MIQRLSTNEALDYLKENKIDISERTYRRYKEEILKQKNKLKSYSQKFVEIEQFKKIETQKNILHECWEMLKKNRKDYRETSHHEDDKGGFRRVSKNCLDFRLLWF